MTSSLRTDTHDGLTISSTQNLNGWKLALAAGVYRAYGGKPYSMFTADVLQIDRLFSEADGRIARRDRINRLYDVPVQVEDLVFRVETGEKAAMYQKTRKLVAEVGTLQATSTRARVVPAPQLSFTPPDVRPTAGLTPSAPASDVAALRAEVAGLSAALLSCGVDPSAGSRYVLSEDRVEHLQGRMGTLETNLRRMEDAIRLIHPDFTFVEYVVPKKEGTAR